EDLRSVTAVDARVEVRGDASDLGQSPHQLASGSPEGGEIPRARSLDDERDQHPRPGGVRALADFAQVDRAKAPAPVGFEGRERAARGLRCPDALAQGCRDGGERWREDAATWNVDDVMAAALREEADRAAPRDDELRSRAVADDRKRRGHGLGSREIEPRIAREGGRDPRSLVNELLAVCQAEERTAAAALGVVTVDAQRQVAFDVAGRRRTFGGPRRGPGDEIMRGGHPGEPRTLARASPLRISPGQRESRPRGPTCGSTAHRSGPG